MNNCFAKMCQRTGGYSLPWLIELEGDITLRFINDNVPREYKGETFHASTFDYIPNAQDLGFSGGGTLDIAAEDAGVVGGLLPFIQTNKNISFKVVGVLLEDNTITEVKTFRHSYGNVTLNGRTASFTFDRDDRLGMSFPALVFSHYNNRGAF